MSSGVAAGGSGGGGEVGASGRLGEQEGDFFDLSEKLPFRMVLVELLSSGSALASL